MKQSPNYLKKNLKNNSKAFVVLCNNCKYFYWFCKWFPKEFNTQYDYYVVFDNRLKDISEELQSIIDATDNEHIKRFNVVNGDEIIEYYKEELPFAIKNKFSLNTLKDFYFLEEYELVYGQDDDVIVFRNGKAFNTDKLVFFETGNLSEKQMFVDYVRDTVPKFVKGFQPVINPSEINDISSGNYFLTKKFYEPYMKAAKMVYTNEEFTDHIVNQTLSCSANGWYLDCLLLKAATTFWGWVDSKKIQFVSVLCNSYLKTHDCQVNKRTCVFHYGAKDKEAIYRTLEKSVLNKKLTPNKMDFEEDNLTILDRNYYNARKR